MKSKTFEMIRVIVADDPLTDAQMRELSGADQDDVVDGDKAAAMLGVELQTQLLALSTHDGVHGIQ